MNPIGIMQGRLSPPVNGRLQAFPVATWREEFPRARDAGLACVEWIYERESEAANPLRHEPGVLEVRRIIERTGIEVRSVCGDYYMAERLLTPQGALRPNAVEHLTWLLRQVGRLGSSHMVLPFVDGSSIRSSAELDALVQLLRSLLPHAERHQVALHLETDLDPEEQVSVMKAVSHPLVRITHDIGNCAAAGHDPQEELSAIGPWVGSVHVKDRLLGGGTVPLGCGAADFPACFRLLQEMGFTGPLILQVARDGGVSELEQAIRDRRFVEERFRLIAAGRA